MERHLTTMLWINRLAHTTPQLLFRHAVRPPALRSRQAAAVHAIVSHQNPRRHALIKLSTSVCNRGLDGLIINACTYFNNGARKDGLCINRTEWPSAWSSRDQ